MEEIIHLTSRYADVCGIKTFYETNGSASDKKIVCFHSEGRETRQFHALMESLRDEYEVIAFDMPAHGKSWPIDGERPIEDWNEYVSFAWSFIEKLGLTDALMLGCGLGASVVFALAIEHDVKGVISIGGSDDAVTELDVRFIDHPYISTPHLVQEYNRSIIGRSSDSEAAEFIHWQAWCETGITYKADLKMMESLALSADMKNIRCPVLAIRGEDDWVADEKKTRDLLIHIGNADNCSVTLEKVGRFAMIEKPELTANAIKDFFNK